MADSKNPNDPKWVAGGDDEQQEPSSPDNNSGKKKQKSDQVVISTKMPRWWGTAFIVLARATCITYVLLAGFTFPEIQKLHRTQFTIIDTTYYVPITICEPGALQLGRDTSIFLDVAELQGCRTMDVLINSCASSLLLSGIAVLIYVVIDLLSRCHHGPYVDRSSVSGMGIFLLFIVFQASSTTWALAEESDFWSDYMDRYWKEQNFAEDYPIVTKVQTYGNETLLWATGSIGACACILIFLESMANLCCVVNEEPAEEDEEEALSPEAPPKVEEEAEAPNEAIEVFPDIDIETGKKQQPQETPVVIPTVIVDNPHEPEIEVPVQGDGAKEEEADADEPGDHDNDDKGTPDKVAESKDKDDDKPNEEASSPAAEEEEAEPEQQQQEQEEEDKEISAEEPKKPVRNSER